MVTEGLGILFNFFRLISIFSGNMPDVRYDKGIKEQSEKPFTPGELVLSTIFNMVEQILGILSAYFLVKATKIPVRQMSSQVYNDQIEVEKHGDFVTKTKFYLILLFLVKLLIMSIDGFFAYVNLNNHFESLYKDKYDEFRKVDISTSTQVYDKADMEKIGHIQQVLSWFGPTMIILFLCCNSCCFGLVYCFFVKYAKNLIKYEESPQNPCNKI